MRIRIADNVRHLLILGAGSSKDYNLPTWNELGLLVEEKLNKSGERNYKKEILDWLSKVDGKKYTTIDECITKESDSKEYRDNGYDIEDEIFLIIQEILDENYQDNENGWIEILNSKILDDTSLAAKLAFINYNYDSVLYRNFLVFKYLSQKAIESTRSRELDELWDVQATAFFPHDYLFSEEDVEKRTHLDIQSDTPKSNNARDINAVSCYDSDHHQVDHYSSSNLSLYILGLGGGLKYNLNKIKLPGSISETHITIKDEAVKDNTLTFLSKKFGIPKEEIHTYSTCDELIESCF